MPSFDKAVRLAYGAAKAGSVEGQLLLVELYLGGHGFPLITDKPMNGYITLNFKKKKQRMQAMMLLSRLSNLLPAREVYNIQNRPQDEF